MAIVIIVSLDLPLHHYYSFSIRLISFEASSTIGLAMFGIMMDLKYGPLDFNLTVEIHLFLLYKNKPIMIYLNYCK